MSSIVVGIDLGTTNSCVAVYRNDEIEILPDENKQKITPSFVYYDEDEDKVAVGSDAQKRSAINPQFGIFDSKRMLGHKFEDKQIQENLNQWPFTVTKGGKGEPQIRIPNQDNYMTIRPEEVSAEILKKMKEIASTALKQDIVNAVITVPAYFLDAQRQATKDSATIAGLNVLKLVNEPDAAALAFIHNQTDIKNRVILVYDLGGGTFDVSLMRFEVINGVKQGEVLAVSGDAYLGGRDFDNNLLQYFLKEISKIYGTAIVKEKPSHYRRKMRRLRNKCEDIKKELSVSEKASIQLSEFDSTEDIDLTITRKQFEEMNHTLFKKTFEIVDKVLRKAKVEKCEIDDVLLVGGSTRIPKIQQMVCDYFDGKIPNKTVNPEEAVARGAAIQAALLNDSPDQNLQKYIITDVTPFALGIEVVGKIFSEIIPENTKIPTFSEERYETAFNNQTSISIKVYEGESIDIDENTLLGEFVINGVEPRRRGEVKIDVKFEMTADVILKVTATESSRGITKNLNIVLDSNRLTPEQISLIKARQYTNQIRPL